MIVKKIFNSLHPNILVIISGILVTTGFPPLKLGFISYMALIPLIYAFERDKFNLGVEKGFLFGVMLNLGILYWLSLNKGTEWYWAVLSMISAVLFLSLNYAMIGFIFGLLGKKLGAIKAIALLPVIWISIEYLRSLGRFGFTWNNLCYTQLYFLPLIQISDIFGSFGLSFFVVMVNSILYLLFFKDISLRARKILLSFICISFAIVFIYGIIRISMYSEKSNKGKFIRVGIVQPNIDPNEKWTKIYYDDVMNTLYNYTDSVAEHNVNLVVWPETAVPVYLRLNQHGEMVRIRNKMKEHKVYLLTGVPDFKRIGGEYKYYNSAFLIPPDEGSIPTYSKLRLVPLGEYIPLSSVFPELGNINFGQGNFESGDSITIFKINTSNTSDTNSKSEVKFTVAICYESSFPDIVRKGVKKGSEMLVVISNDAWFGMTSAPYLHAEISRFRAVENRIPVVRAANTGVSMFIMPDGKVKRKIGFNKKGYLVADVLTGTGSLNTKIGDWFSILNTITLAVLIVAIFIKRKEENR